MAIREIIKYGDPRLVAFNKPVIDFDETLQALIRDLLDTCRAAPGVGIAAPQVGVNLRIAVVDVSIGEDPAQVLVLANPKIVDASGAVRDEEGCLSFPDLVEIVERPEEVFVEAADEKGKVRTLRGTDFLARAFCHEVDHLDARLFVDRMSSLKKALVLRKVLKRQKRGDW